jgi:hypothetical protein
MDNASIKQLCLDVLRSDTEDEVIKILRQNDLWDNPNYWRFYGDQENNYSSAGNQADEAESALIEKITNARDAILMNECLEAGIDPEGSEAPKSVKEAVARFFEENPDHELAGQIREWDNKKRREIAQKISVYITGAKPGTGIYPCVNVADLGEGQTPDKLPNTILSLGKSIKLRIPFVHGKFNMGGTAALVYCGRNNLQLVLSKRNPKLLPDDCPESDKDWGFTIVKREDPKGNFYSSVYKYLAPVEADINSCKGKILSFSSDEMPIFAKFNMPYATNSKWGTIIKLYEYETRYKQNVQGSGGLLRPLDLLAPDLGLPYRLHECRYDGKPASFEHQINGLRVRLFDDKGSALVNSYPSTYKINIDGEEFTIIAYAFIGDKALTYRDSDKGVIYTLNGQSQGWLDDRFFSRSKVGLGFLRKSLLVFIDCSNLTYLGQEKLFINDRVHIRRGPLQEKLEDALEDYLGNHEGLKELQEERKRSLKAQKIDNSKPLEAVLANVMKHSAALSRIFLKGERLSSAFKNEKVASTPIDYEGNQFPTYFKFPKINYGKDLKRDANMYSRCRVTFETDAENMYFSRKTNPGYYKLFLIKDDEERVEVNQYLIENGLKLYNGIGTLNISIDEKFKIGETYKFLLEVSDPMRIIDPPFQNRFILTILKQLDSKIGTPSPRINPPSDNPGKEREKPSGIEIPETIPVYEKDWELNGLNKFSALKAVTEKGDDGTPRFTFFVNMDNIYLQHEIKQDLDHRIETEAYFQMGLALIAISLIYDEEQNKESFEKDKSPDLEDKIESFSRAVAPILIPMIKEFGDMDLKGELLKEISG